MPSRALSKANISRKRGNEENVGLHERVGELPFPWCWGSFRAPGSHIAGRP